MAVGPWQAGNPPSTPGAPTHPLRSPGRNTSDLQMEFPNPMCRTDDSETAFHTCGQSAKFPFIYFQKGLFFYKLQAFFYKLGLCL